MDDEDEQDTTAARATASKKLGFPLTQAAKATESAKTAAQPVSLSQPGQTLQPGQPAPASITTLPSFAATQKGKTSTGAVIGKTKKTHKPRRRAGLWAAIIVALFVVGFVGVELYIARFSWNDFRSNTTALASSVVQGVQGLFSRRQETPRNTPSPVRNTVQPNDATSSPSGPTPTPRPNVSVDYLTLLGIAETDALSKLAPYEILVRDVYEDQHGIVVLLRFDTFQLRLRGGPLQGDEQVGNEWIAAQTGPVFKIGVQDNDSPITHGYPLIGKTKDEAEGIMSDDAAATPTDATSNQLFYIIAQPEGPAVLVELYFVNDVVEQIIYSMDE